MDDGGREPWMIASMGELLALAQAMEQEAIIGYLALAERMRQENRPDLERVFERLIVEERGHLGNVDKWLAESGVVSTPTASPPEPLFDDEGAALVAPELLNSYRAFSMAVRNEERAFVFWTYVSAHAASEEIRKAAERMAREELGHVATLRRERRRAFHDLRKIHGEDAPVDLAALELRLSDHLEGASGRAGGARGEKFHALAREAQARSSALREPWANGAGALGRLPQGAADRMIPLIEFLLDSYLNLAEHQSAEDAHFRMQEFAGGLIRCLQAAREGSA